MNSGLVYGIEVLAGFAVSVAIGHAFVPYIKRLKIGQHIRGEGPRAHFKKAGTPTMGGVIFLLGTLVPAIAEGFFGLLGRDAWLAIGVFFAFGLIGFIDDWRKFRLGRSLGLRAREKMGLAILAAAVFLYIWRTGGGSSDVIVPVINRVVHLGALYPVFGVLVMVGSSNAMNLTDGLDGLAAGVSAIGLAALSRVALAKAALNGAGGLEHLAPTAIGAILGFLVYNRHPAKIFMGDTGSLALGALLAAFGILTKTELLLLFFAGVPVVETLSVIAQVISFQLFGRRIFKMSPLHHHFELLGWPEVKVVRTFWLAQALLAAAGIWVMTLV
ncbi:MAG: phospho-N-acetylmuramoyl-pentapeptide-transferase [Firmicutes bacterium]|nr:phospho-N-acetylmuramoyl-pentapeptide-transferase [Candidatus Fermentithermobacillaceae bacterium]